MVDSFVKVEKVEAAVTPVSSKSLTLSFPIVLFGLAILVYLGTTGLLPLVGRDEPRYVEIGREMLNSGDWITPRLGNFTWFEKPALLYWMVAASFAVFGVSEWAARLGPALCGLGSATFVYWMARPTNEKWARWSAITMLSSGGMLAFSHGATFDIVVTCCLTLALAAWWRAQQEPQAVNRYLALFWVGVGLSLLAKGLIGFVLPLGTIGIYALLRRERVALGVWWGVPLAILVSAVWYGPVMWVNGAKFFNEFFIQHHFQRFTSDKFKHHQPFWFYAEIMPLLMLPWTPYLLWACSKMKPKEWREEAPEVRLRVFAFAWMLAPIAFFSLSGSKLPSYILPSMGGASVLVGWAVGQWRDNRAERVAGALAGVTFITAAVLTLCSPGIRLAERNSVRQLFEAAHQHNLGQLRVASFRSIVRPAQFYGATHLIYSKDGEPLCLENMGQLQTLTRNEPLLLVVSDDDYTGMKSPHLRFKTIADNGKTALVLVASASS